MLIEYNDYFVFNFVIIMLLVEVVYKVDWVKVVLYYYLVDVKLDDSDYFIYW